MEKVLKNSKVLKSVIHEISEIAGYLWQRGWAERNAGNISVNITDLKSQEIPDPELYPFINLDVSRPELADNFFLVTCTGSRMRAVARKPMKNILIIKLNKEASGYWILTARGLGDPRLPTSELPTHLGIHQMIAARASDEKVVLHTHATELIALTHEKSFCTQAKINKILWSMHPETIMFIPKGVGFVPYSLPGTAEIATETIKTLRNHDVALWEKHGVFAIGKSISDSFDIIDILAKSARIYFMCRSVNIDPEGFTQEQLDELKKITSAYPNQS